MILVEHLIEHLIEHRCWWYIAMTSSGDYWYCYQIINVTEIFVTWYFALLLYSSYLYTKCDINDCFIFIVYVHNHSQSCMLFWHPTIIALNVLSWKLGLVEIHSRITYFAKFFISCNTYIEKNKQCDQDVIFGIDNMSRVKVDCDEIWMN